MHSTPWGEQREALILAGAQAIYVHTGTAELAGAEFTTDGDLVVVPNQLKALSRLANRALRSRGRQGRCAPLRGASRWSASLTAAPLRGGANRPKGHSKPTTPERLPSARGGVNPFGLLV